MKPIIAACCILLSSLAYTYNTDDLAHIEYRGRPYTSLQINDIFGAAQLIKHLLAHSKELKEVLKNPVDIVRATFFVGSIAAMVKVSLLGVQSLSVRFPEIIKAVYKSVSLWVKRRLGIAEGFEVEQLVMCEQLLKSGIGALCEYASQKDRQTVIDLHWEFQREHIQQLVHYITGFLMSHEPFYRHKQVKMIRRGVLNVYTDDNKIDHMCFMIRSLTGLLKHIMSVCQKSVDIQEFDVAHVQKVTCNILMLFKQIRHIICGVPKQDIDFQEYSSFEPQAYMPTTHLFDFFT